MSQPLPVATPQRYPVERLTISKRIKRSLEVFATHVAMFGYVSAVRAGLSRIIGPKYGHEDFDATYGVDTSAVSLATSQMPQEWIADAVRYEPVNVGVLHHMFRSLPFRLDEYHLVDVGCGKGRTLMVGAEYPFSAITGIELSPVSARIATENIARNRRHVEAKCTAVNVKCENAVDFTIPSGNLLVTLYNPFVGQTFERCIEHLHRAALANPARRIWLAYINPWTCEETLAKLGYFHRVELHRPIPRHWAWSLWRHVDA
jgi:hypothetical protein